VVRLGYFHTSSWFSEQVNQSCQPHNIVISIMVMQYPYHCNSNFTILTAWRCDSAVYSVIVCPSVCPSGCLSVTSRSSIKTAILRITQAMPYTGILVLKIKILAKYQWGNPNRGAEYRWGLGWVKWANFDQYLVISPTGAKQGRSYCGRLIAIRMHSIECSYFQWSCETLTIQATSFSTHCIAFHIFVVWGDRDFECGQ